MTLEITNLVVAVPGDSRHFVAIDASASNLFVAVTKNEHGEQLAAVFDFEEGSATLYHSDAGTCRIATTGVSEMIRSLNFSDAEQTWLASVCTTAEALRKNYEFNA